MMGRYGLGMPVYADHAISILCIIGAVLSTPRRTVAVGTMCVVYVG